MTAVRRRRVYRVITCANCERTGFHAAHGWCFACYSRWLDAGKPTDGPPAPHSHRRIVDELAVEIAASPCVGDRDVPALSPAERIAATVLLTARGWAAPRIAERLRVTKRSVERYRSASRAGAGGAQGP